MISDQIKTWPQYCLPQHALSRLMGLAVHNQNTWFKNWLINAIIKHYKVDMNEAIEPDPLAYPDFHHFFIRHLKPDTRPIANASDAISSPSDGTISQLGEIKQGQLLQAKGINYSLQSLLGNSASLATEFQDGHFMTVYLAPRDYHRVHMPLTGKLREMIFVPGKLFSVSDSTTRTVPQLFARNERVISIFDTAIGPMAVIMVGAMLVASIHTTWEGVVTPRKPREIQTWRYSHELTLEKGEEMGYFTHGSTVILLFGHNKINWLTKLNAGSSLKFGEQIGTIL